MFSWLEDALRKVSSEVITFVKAIIWIVGGLFALKPVFKAVDAGKDGNWGEVIKWLGAIIAIFLITFIGVKLLEQAVEAGDSDVNDVEDLLRSGNAIQYIALPIATAASLGMKKLKDKVTQSTAQGLVGVESNLMV